MSRPEYRVRAVLHHNDGLSHPDYGALVAYDRRLSYHATLERAEHRRDHILAQHGSTARVRVGTLVKWVEIARRNPDFPDTFDKVEAVFPDPIRPAQ